MNEVLIYIIGGGIGVIVVLITLFLFFSNDDSAVSEESLKNLVHSQRKSSQGRGKTKVVTQKGKAALLAAHQGKAGERKEDVNSPGVPRKLYYARWKINALQYRIIQISVTAIITAGIYPFLKLPLVLLSIFMTPLLIDSILERKIRSRFNNFDKDYPDF
jgi:hypothetical protein